MEELLATGTRKGASYDITKQVVQKVIAKNFPDLFKGVENFLE